MERSAAARSAAERSRAVRRGTERSGASGASERVTFFPPMRHFGTLSARGILRLPFVNKSHVQGAWLPYIIARISRSFLSRKANVAPTDELRVGPTKRF